MDIWQLIAYSVMGIGIVSFIAGLIITNPFLIVFGIIAVLVSIFLPSSHE
ncbi:MAG: hypothetical protein LUQ65_07740 [Candidatus Helarchaeota archaeon]|nr:hypothetical protein [Candidatus Helarchaeota archaeon]